MADTDTVTRCEGCEALEVRVRAIEDAITASKEQAAAMLAKVPKPMRKMLGFPED